MALKPGAETTPEELRAFVKSQVAAYKYPRHVWIVDELPKGATGKILKREIDAAARSCRRGRSQGGRTMAAGRQPAPGRPSARRAGRACWAGRDACARPSPVAPRFFAPGPAVKVAAGLARRPPRRRPARRRADHRAGARRHRALAARSGRGGPPVRATRAWQENWLLRELLQAYLAVGETVDGLIDDAGVDWRAERQARLAAGNVHRRDRARPTSRGQTRPCCKEIVNTGGANLVRGAAPVCPGRVRPPRLPATVDTSQFEVGGNLAVTPGSVVLRTEVLELIHYKPQTEQVREVPLLFVPPTINKYYILDLAPGRSLIEYLAGQGQQVFAMSWRNPEQAQGHFDLDTYAQAVAEARDAVAEIAGADAASTSARRARAGSSPRACSGTSPPSGERAKVASLTLMVCALDNAQAEGRCTAFATRDLAAAAVAESARKGYLDGQALAGVFTWLRPNDLVWSYVVNNYLLGKEPPAFDILYWNQDTVRLAAGLHRDFIQHRHWTTRSPVRGALEVLGSPGRSCRPVDVDTYVVAGLNDHIVPWENAYRSAQLFGGARRFVLSTQRPHPGPGQPAEPATSRARSYRVAEDLEPAMRRRSWLRRRRCRQLVAGLGRVAGRAVGRPCAGAARASGNGASGPRPKPREAMSSPAEHPTRSRPMTGGGVGRWPRPAGGWSWPGCSSIRSSGATACRAATAARSC